MRSSHGTIAVGAILAWMLLAPAARGQGWARAMFDGKTTQDFGVVARGAKVEHRFAVENIYEEDVHIQSISSSCGCSKAETAKRTLKTWEKAEIVVAMDTRGYLGRKDSTITVVFDLPFHAEVQLHVYVYIRGDVVVQPGAAEFGSVGQAAGATRTLRISYAGRGDWRIERVECANPHVEAGVVETGRAAGKVAYNLTVTLKKDAPPGYIRDHLVLVTNDRDARSARVPVAVEGVVTSALSVRPSPLSMGLAEVGRPVTRNLVVQGHSAFHILAVRSSDRHFQCQTSDQAKTLHIVPVTFLVDGSEAALGRAETTIRIKTDLPGTVPVEVRASVQVVPPKSPRP